MEGILKEGIVPTLPQKTGLIQDTCGNGVCKEGIVDGAKASC
jgi:hypothetical protein